MERDIGGERYRGRVREREERGERGGREKGEKE